MHAKVVTFQIKQGKRDEVIRLFNEFVVPGAAPPFRGRR